MLMMIAIVAEILSPTKVFWIWIYENGSTYICEINSRRKSELDVAFEKGS